MRFTSVFRCEKKADMVRVLIIEKDRDDRIGYSVNSALELIQRNDGRIIDIDIKKYNDSYLGTITYRGAFLVRMVTRDKSEIESGVEVRVNKEEF